jgi:hypothetical protein
LLFAIPANPLVFDSRTTMRHAVLPDHPHKGECRSRMSEGLVEC